MRCRVKAGRAEHARRVPIASVMCPESLRPSGCTPQARARNAGCLADRQSVAPEACICVSRRAKRPPRGSKWVPRALITIYQQAVAASAALGPYSNMANSQQAAPGANILSASQTVVSAVFADPRAERRI